MKNPGISEENIFDFIKKHQILIIFSYIVTFCVYGIWIFQDYITFDEEGLYIPGTADAWYRQWIGLNRFSLVFLKRILGVYLANPFFSSAVFLFLFPLTAILWVYCFTKWKNEYKSIPSFLFVTLFLTCPVWALQFAYQNQMEVIQIIMFLMPADFLILTEYLDTGKKSYAFIFLLLTVFVFGGYQSFIFWFLCGLAAMFLCQIDRKYKHPQEIWIDAFRCAILTIAAFVLYELIARFCIFHWNGTDAGYLSEQIEWFHTPLRKCLEKVGNYLSRIMMGRNTNLYSPIISVEVFFFAVLNLINFVQKKKWPGFKLLLSIMLFAFTFLLGIITTGNQVERSEFAYVFTTSFSIYYLCSFFRSTKHINMICCMIAAVLIPIIYIEPLTRFLYTDSDTMKEDKEWMSQVYFQAMQKGAKEGDALCVIGYRLNYQKPSYRNNEVVGFSYFQVPSAAPMKLTQAMQAYGYPVAEPTEDQMKEARKAAKQMTTWPDKDSIRVSGNLIILKLS